MSRKASFSAEKPALRIILGWSAACAATVMAIPAGSAAASQAPSTSTSTSVSTQARIAAARLGANLAAPHAGIAEALAHPDADHMVATTGGAGRQAAAALPHLAVATTGNARGLDVSSYQGNVNWSSAFANGARFAYVKATEGTYYTDSTYFPEQYNGSYNAGMIRGAYHFAIPNNSGGAAQADYFVAHGGGWSADGKTLPGTLDIEYNPYGSECYGLTASQMVSWVQSFSNEYRTLTGRYPTVYTTTDWWSTCTGNTRLLSHDGLALASYASSPGPLPASWSGYDIWQYADSGLFPGDQDVFNGPTSLLQTFAYGSGVFSSGWSGCAPGTDQRSPAEAAVQPGVVIGGSTYTVGAGGGLSPIVTSAPGGPLAAVWQNSTDCAGDPNSRNAWAVTPAGKVYGESTRTGPPAGNYGDTSGVRLAKPMVGMAPTYDGGGYWLVASDGGIFSYGDATFFGSTGGVPLVRPVVGMAGTADSGGYWLVASDGGVFSFGDARFHGSLGGVNLVKPIEAMVATPDGGGYWMVASDGGVFSFGDARFRGSMGGQILSAPIAGMVPNGTGYTLIGQDGRTYPFP